MTALALETPPSLSAAPVLKWAGGKRQLLPEIMPRLPSNIRAYHEPFFGGGAVFFALANERGFKRAVVGDANDELVNLYTVIRDDVAALISALGQLSHSEAAYYSARSSVPAHRVDRAARTIYLNRTGFNGLYRVNKKGQFNVPFGRHTNPTICDADRIIAASAALRSVDIVHGDFASSCADAQPGDCVYLDPPYLPASPTASFAAYQASGFGIAETERLADLCRDLRARGVNFLLSNSDTPETRRIFADFKIETVSARRNINSSGAKRGAVNEILVS